MNRILLSGGAIKGVINHIAFLSAYDSEHQAYESVSVNGTSAGALTGALYSKYGPGHMEDVIKDLKYIFSYKTVLSSIHIQGNPFATNISFLKHDNFRKKMHKVLPKNFSDLKCDFLCYATDIPTGKAVKFSKSSNNNVDLPDAVLASMSFPGAFRPMKVDGFELLDGGILMNVPFSDFANVVLMGASRDNFYIVDTSPNWLPHEYKYSLLALFDIVRNKLEDDMYIEVMNGHPNAHLIPGNLVDEPGIPGPSIILPWVYNKYINKLVEAATSNAAISDYKVLIK